MTMIAAALRVEIERRAAAMRCTNPLLHRAADGSLHPEHLARYLASVHQLVLHTPIHLARAHDRALARGNRRLAAHYAAKVRDEHGHDLWAERDLDNVATLRGGASVVDAAPAIRDLIDYVGALVERDPTSYLAYILVAEYVTVLLGPEWLLQLETRCGIPRSSMTLVGNHVELDQAHTQDAFDHLDELVGDPRSLPVLREVVVESLRLFEAFCHEVVALGDGSCAETRIHAPAA